MASLAEVNRWVEQERSTPRSGEAQMWLAMASEISIEISLRNLHVLVRSGGPSRRASALGREPAGFVGNTGSLGETLQC